MGVFYVDFEIVNVRRPKKTAAVPRLLIDSGSEYTWIPAETLKQLGVAVAKKVEPFQMANGMIITRQVGYAVVRAAGFETVDEIVFAEPGDLALLALQRWLTKTVVSDIP